MPWLPLSPARAAPAPRGPTATAVERGGPRPPSLALRLRERREGGFGDGRRGDRKPLELALGETRRGDRDGALHRGGRAPLVRAHDDLAWRIAPCSPGAAGRCGVAALIVGFNPPLPNLAWKTFPAIFCGNSAVLKPSEHHLPPRLGSSKELALEGRRAPASGYVSVVQELPRPRGRRAPRRASGRPDLIQLHRLRR